VPAPNLSQDTGCAFTFFEFFTAPTLKFRKKCCLCEKACFAIILTFAVGKSMKRVDDREFQ
jgi:hypothetical protein